MRTPSQTTAHNNAFELQPIINAKVGAKQYSMTFLEFMDRCSQLGIDVDNFNSWGSTKSFNWAPPIDFDKLINYQNYYWTPQLAIEQKLNTGSHQIPEYMVIKSPYTIARTRYLTFIQNINNIASNHSSDIQSITSNLETPSTVVPDVKCQIHSLGIHATHTDLIISGDITRITTIGTLLTGVSSNIPSINNTAFTVVASKYDATTIQTTVTVDAIVPSASKATGYISFTPFLSMLWYELLFFKNQALAPPSQHAINNIGQIIWAPNYLVQITSDTEPLTPAENQLFYNHNANTLSEYNNGQWTIALNNFSLLVNSTYGKPLIQYQNININPWINANMWVHRSQLSSLDNSHQAKMPIIEYNTFLSLNEWNQTNYIWYYRANTTDQFIKTSNAPTLFELEQIKTYTISNSTTIILDAKYGNMTDGLRSGSKIKIKQAIDTPTNNGTYEIKTSIFSNQQTTIQLTSNLLNITDTTGTINPIITTAGDPWIKYDTHWAFGGIDNVVPINQQTLTNLDNLSLSTSGTFTTNDNKFESKYSPLAQQFIPLNDMINGTLALYPLVLDLSLTKKCLVQTNDVHVYINNVQQYGNYSEDYNIINGVQYITSITFNTSTSVLTSDVITICIAQSTDLDAGRATLNVRTDLSSTTAVPTMKVSSLIRYRPHEQQKTTTNQYPVFDIFNLDGTTANAANCIFKFKPSTTPTVTTINPYINKRIEINNTNNYIFEQLLSTANNILYAYGEVRLNTSTIQYTSTGGIELNSTNTTYPLGGAYTCDYTLETIWKRSPADALYIPLYLDASNKEVPIGSVNGYWGVPDTLAFNVNHNNKSTISFSDILLHFKSIIKNQPPTPGILVNAEGYYVIETPDYGLGGTIKEFNGNFDKLLSAIFVDDITPNDVINNAREQYGDLLANIRTVTIENIHKLFTDVSKIGYQSIITSIINTVITSHQENEYYSKLYGDSTTYDQTTGKGMPNWIATLPYLKQAVPQSPQYIFDQLLGIQEIIHHDGHTSQLNITQDIVNDVMTSLINAPDLRLANGNKKLGIHSNSLPPQSTSNFEIAFNTSHVDKLNGVLWQLVTPDEITMYRFNTTLIIGTDLSKAWEPFTIYDIVAQVILEIEQKLYDYAPKTTIQLQYELTTTTGSPTYQQIKERLFNKYVEQNNITNVYANTTYQPENAFTWNYQGSTASKYPTDSTTTTHPVTGVWQNLYLQLYQTSYPHLEPWKLQGYVSKPPWWESYYAGISRRWNKTMWTNISNGIIPYGEISPDLSTGQGAAGQVTQYVYVPINIDDATTLDGYAPDQLFPPYWNISNNGPQNSGVNRSVFASLSEINNPQQDYAYNTGSYPQWLYTRQLPYLYDLQLLAFLTNPMEYFATMFNPNRVEVNQLYLNSTSDNILSHQNEIFHGQYINNATYISAGINQWYVNFARLKGIDINNSKFSTQWKSWDVNVGYQFNGFIDTETLHITNQRIEISKNDYFLVVNKDTNGTDLWFDAINIALYRVPIGSATTNVQANWQFNISTTSPIANPINAFNVQQYQYTIDPITSTCTLTNTKYNINSIQIDANNKYYYFIIDGNYITDFTIGHTIQSIRTFATETWTIQNVTFDPQKIETKITVAEKIDNINETGTLIYYPRTLPPSWTTGTMVKVSASETLPTKLSFTDNQVFLIRKSDISFQYARSASDATTDKFIPFTDVGKGTQSVGMLASTFIITDTTDVWDHYELDLLAPVRTIQQNTKIIGIQNIINLVDGYKYYLEELGITSNLSDAAIDPLSGGTITWNSELRRFISWCYQEFNTTQAVDNSFSLLNQSHLVTSEVNLIKSLPGFTTIDAPAQGTLYSVGYQQIKFSLSISATTPLSLNASTFYKLIITVDGVEYIIKILGSDVTNFGDLANIIQNQTNNVVDVTFNNYMQIASITTSINSTISISTTIDTSLMYVNTANQPQWATGLVVKVQGIKLPNPLTLNGLYYIINIDSSHIQLANSTYDAQQQKNIKLTSPGGGEFIMIPQPIVRKLPTLEFNPFRSSLIVKTPTGVMGPVTNKPIFDILSNEMIYDQNISPIPPTALFISREDKQTTISINISDPINIYDVTHIGGGHILISDYQHIILFNNYTVSGNLLYDSFLGLYVPSINVDYFIQTSNTKRPSIGGFSLNDSTVLKNFEQLADQLRYLYDTHKADEHDPITKLSRELIGYIGNDQALSDINIDSKSQFLFWKALLQHKGSTNSLLALLNAKTFNNIKIDEFYAYKIADYGDSRLKINPTIKLRQSDVSASGLKYDFVTDSSLLPVPPQFNTITITDQTRWYRQPDQYAIFQKENIDTFSFDVKQARAIENSTAFTTLPTTMPTTLIPPTTTTTTTVAHPTLSKILNSIIQFDPASVVVHIDETAPYVSLVLNRTQSSEGDVSIILSTQDGTAKASTNYQFTHSIITWVNGDATSKTINIPIVNDHVYDGNYGYMYFTAKLTVATGKVTVGKYNQATIYIKDMQQPPATVNVTGPSTLTGSCSSALSSCTATATGTYSASGGTSPYIYSWQYQTGDTEITINSSTSSSPIFSATSTGSQLIAQWLLTVTDSASPTNTSSIPVYITLSYVQTTTTTTTVATTTTTTTVATTTTTAAPISIVGPTLSNGTCNQSPNQCTISTTSNCVISGGALPYSIAWTEISETSDPTTVVNNTSISSTSSISPTWTSIAINAYFVSHWQMIVTDNMGTTAQITIKVIHYHGTVGPNGGGGGCVRTNMFVGSTVQAKDVAVGTLLLSHENWVPMQRVVIKNEIRKQPCVRIITENGAILDCSTTTPFEIPDTHLNCEQLNILSLAKLEQIPSKALMSPKMLNQTVLTDRGFEQVVDVQDIGRHNVCLISVGGYNYAAGSNRDYKIYSHNMTKKKF